MSDIFPIVKQEETEIAISFLFTLISFPHFIVIYFFNPTNNSRICMRFNILVSFFFGVLFDQLKIIYTGL